ncbi:MAG: type III pantothenate kinase [Methylotenera sp.]|nr:type III pantothenate kinase [Methylotenera sp.]
MVISSLNTAQFLAIDIGNTRSKWALFDASGTMLKHGACLNTALTTLILPKASRVLVSNVAGNIIKAQLETLLMDYSQINWLITPSAACDVINRYTLPSSLGSDRWAALIAAWHIKQTPCVVVNAGTAVTIDALTSNNHQAAFIGGLILPGLNLMQQSLGQATAQLPVAASWLAEGASTPRHKVVFPKDTADALYTGALQAITGAIASMSHALHGECKQLPAIIISGGNAQQIKDSLMGEMIEQALIVDNLVLHGLYWIDHFMQSEQP